jgi:L-alanine-DL-glutamate epimerase-like enolase superfamily enzyme
LSWTIDLFVEPLEAVEGRVMIPQGPGWGVTVRPDWLDKAQRQESA